MPKAKATKAAPVAKKGKRAGKTKKDPLAPKRGLTAFMFYSGNNRARVREENPDAKFGEMGKILGAEWKALSEDDKVQYQLLANTDKERYANAMKNYDGPTMIPAKGKKAKKTGPKKPSSAYILFSKEAREDIKEETPDLTFGEIGKEIGARWKVIEADEKSRFEDLAALDKVRYEKEVKKLEQATQEAAVEEVEEEEEVEEAVSDVASDVSDDEEDSE